MNAVIDTNKFSFIDAHEEEEAKKFIEQHLGFPAPRVCGYYMAVKLYVRPEEVSTFTDKDGKEIKIILPESARVEDKWRSCTALVLSQGPQCYKGKKFKDSGPWCKVGDWIVIPRNEGVQVNYRGIPMQYIPDDRVLGIIEDPTHVVRD